MIHILAVGDSLTRGYFQYGTQYHPYTNNLQNLLDQKGKYPSSLLFYWGINF